MAACNKASSRNQVYMGGCRCVKEKETQAEIFKRYNERKAASEDGNSLDLWDSHCEIVRLFISSF